jgi:hypothetical protein
LTAGQARVTARRQTCGCVACGEGPFEAAKKLKRGDLDLKFEDLQDQR